MLEDTNETATGITKLRREAGIVEETVRGKLKEVESASKSAEELVKGALESRLKLIGMDEGR
ncbi:MAG: hypothetical protein WDW19_05685 [Neisseriaceae bacterium]